MFMRFTLLIFFVLFLLLPRPITAEVVKQKKNFLWGLGDGSDGHRALLDPLAEGQRQALALEENIVAIEPTPAPLAVPQASGAIRRVLTLPAAPAPTIASTEGRLDNPANNSVFIRFNNVEAAEFIRMVSHITNKNFVFDETDLDFNVTVISEEPTTTENLMTILLQELRIHGLNLIEEGNNVIIHRNIKVNSISRVLDDNELGGGGGGLPKGVEIVTQVFHINSINLDNAITILKPLASQSAIIDPLPEGNQLIVTDLVSNVAQIAKLLRAVDAPKGGLVVGQYVAKNTALEVLIALAEKILAPMTKHQSLVFVPHPAAGSIFIVSTPFFVERSLAILEHIDQTQPETGVYDEKERRLKNSAAKEEAKREKSPTPEELNNIEPGGWGDIRGRKAFSPKITPEEAKGNKPPTGIWKRDTEGNWNFEAGPTGSSGGLPTGSHVVGGQWKVSPTGAMQYEGEERPRLPTSGLPPMGTWYRDELGRAYFEKGQNYGQPPESVAPLGHWEQNEQGKWNFAQNQGNRMPMGGGMPPRGRWYRDEANNWQFESNEQGTVGGLPPQTIWMRDASGSWAPVPSSLQDVAPGTYPEGVWRYGSTTGSWQFVEGGKLALPAGMPPEGLPPEGLPPEAGGREGAPPEEGLHAREGAPPEQGAHARAGGQRPQLPASGLPPVGAWYKDELGKSYFEKAENYAQPVEGAPPMGQWVQDGQGRWHFEQEKEYAMPMGGMPPRGRWYRDEANNWQFEANEQGTVGGLPQQATWMRDAGGSWAPVPSSLHAVVPGTYPEGVWRYNSDTAAWQFMEGRKLTLPEGAPPEGIWTHEPEGTWSFKAGPHQENGSVGGVPKEGFWSIDDAGSWRYILQDKELQAALPRGKWQRDSHGTWSFQELEPSHFTEGGLPKGASWVMDSQGNWGVIPETVPKGVSLPKGVWKYTAKGWQFLPGQQLILPEGAPPAAAERRAEEGFWRVDELGKWRFIARPGKEKASVGFWGRNSHGQWYFQGMKREEFSPGGSGDTANWIMDKEGNWAIMPGTAAANAIPEGIWQQKRGTWRFVPHGHLSLPEGAPPKGHWQMNDRGELEFMPGVESPFPGQGTWLQEPSGGWRFVPTKTTQLAPGTSIKSGVWMPQGKEWTFIRDEEKWLTPQGTIMTPRGHWMRNGAGKWVFVLEAGETVQARRLTRPEPVTVELPLGHIERTKFFIYKLQFRNGEQIQDALKRIGESLLASGNINEDLVSTITSTQWLQASNSLVFTGATDSLRKVRELVSDLDRPLRQVFFDMLVMQVSLTDSLEYGVTWATSAGGGNTSTAQTFTAGATPVVTMLGTAGLGPTGTALVPSAVAALSGFPDYTGGIVGQKITHNGTEFASISAVVRAEHDKISSNILLNPKILTEDNVSAEIFVGINEPFKTQSIANDQGNTITTSFDFRDVGIRMKVTPIIGDNDMITLEIVQELSQVQPSATATGNVNIDPPPTISLVKTTTRIHVPSNYFVVLSGMLQDSLTATRNQVPCLGGIPFLGGLFSHKLDSDTKQNLMIFIHPLIINTDQDLQDITKREQDIFRAHNETKSTWRFEVDEALDWLNVRGLDEPTFFEKLRAPVCPEDNRNEDKELKDACAPCGKQGERYWRDNRRLYH